MRGLGRGGGAKKCPDQFFLWNFYKRRKQLLKLSDFQFQSFCHSGVKFQVHTQCQYQITELEPRQFLKKSGSSGQILIKSRLWYLLSQKCQSSLKTHEKLKELLCQCCFIKLHHNYTTSVAATYFLILILSQFLFFILWS